MRDVYFQDLYGGLVNWRHDKIAPSQRTGKEKKENEKYKEKVVGGYIKILAFANRACNIIDMNKGGK